MANSLLLIGAHLWRFVVSVSAVDEQLKFKIFAEPISLDLLDAQWNPLNGWCSFWFYSCKA